MPARFDQLTKRLHDIVDGQWGEQFVVHPQKAADDYVVGGADPDRAVWGPKIGVFMQAASSVKDGPSGGPDVSGDFMLEIQDVNMPPYEIIEGDSIELPERDGRKWYKVGWINPNETGLTILHMTYDFKSRT